ncbi:MAG TPA: hypothetical protein DHV36_10410 [Desulfobacteraceae bacterium]|nr:hypothetical protein [Desulfobacteraceae bacterium]
MNRFCLLLIIGIFCVSSSVPAWSEQAPKSVVDLANTTLATFGASPEIVSAVKAQNKMKKSLADIQAMDERWKATPGIAPFMKELMDSDCGVFLRQLQDSAPYYAEIFVMDNQGANVAMTDKTSDYWQGDEAKFKRSFNSGQGQIFVDEVEFDESSQVYVVQVSVPVMDGDRAIGAITFGIDVDQIQ